MNNFEKFKDEILSNAKLGNSFSLVNGHLGSCENTDCQDCDFHSSNFCTPKRIEWLYEEYQDPPVDWSKVDVDTKILVSSDNTDWKRRYFAKYENDKVYVWNGGCTSWSTESYVSWVYSKLAEEDKD